MFYKAVLFDLDDTLYDRSQAFKKFVELFISSYSFATDIENSSALRDTLYELDCQGYKPRREMFTEIINTFSLQNSPDLEELINFYCLEFPKCVEPTPELYNTLDWFLYNNITMGIVTNGPTQMQNDKIDKLKIRKYMSTIIISEEAGVKKPDSKIFSLALKQIDMKNKSTLYVGDNPSVDIKGANDSGLISVWLSDGQVWDIEDYKPVITIGKLSELISKVIDNNENN